MEKQIVLKSTQKGFISQYFWAAVWVALLAVLMIWADGQKETIGEYDMPWPHLVYYFSIGSMALIAIWNFFTICYETREINILQSGKEGLLSKIICRYYGFPFSKSVNQLDFDRIIRIDVHQGSICRILNTGKLEIKMITFTNADSKEATWTVKAIKDPYKRKAEIEEVLREHEGLMVKMTTS